MDISVKVLADSAYGNHRMTTFECHYHRYILPEVNTHRALGKNGASSRAIPTKKLVAMAREEKVEPIEWGLDQSGMQAFTVADAELEAEGRAIWNEAREDAIKHALKLNELGFAKQIVNRVIEPYLSTRTVLSGTEWNNFRALRDHKDAQPEFREMAAQIVGHLKNHSPVTLGRDEWHRPYIEDGDRERAANADPAIYFDTMVLMQYETIDMGDYFTSPEELLLNMTSAARSARASYRTVSGAKTDFNLDLELFQRLVRTQPVHASPTEHQAIPAPAGMPPHMTAHLRGFIPFRRLIKNETVWG